MEVGVSRLLTLRGVTATKSSVPFLSSSKRRNKHQDANKLGKHANLSTQSCQTEKKFINETVQTKSYLPAFGNLELFRSKIAVSDVNGDYLYEDVYLRSWDLAQGVIDLLGDSCTGRHVALLCPGGLGHVISVWSCWLSGHVAVPLCPSSDQERLEYQMMKTKCNLVITTPDQVNRIHNLVKNNGIKMIVLDDTWWSDPKTVDDIQPDFCIPSSLLDPDLIKDSNALILYTSGMTQKPRGVIYNHQTLSQQIENVVKAWDMTSSDSVLHSLNLDSMYGSVLSLQAPLSSGARITLLPTSQVCDTTKIWSTLLGVGLKSGKPLPKINLFPSVPSTYISLLQSYTELCKDKKTKDYVKSSCGKRIRLMVSSTSSLPNSVISQWKNVTGHKIVDNFVSTESGLGLEERQTQIVKFRDHTKSQHDVLAQNHGNENSDDPSPIITGELRVKLTSDVIDTKYIDENERISCEEGWFHTGDLVEFADGSHRLWGKLNMYKIFYKNSWVDTLEVEKKILSHKDIDDCYVLGLGDIKESQQLAVVLVLTQSRRVIIDNILEWCSQNISDHMVPNIFKMVSRIDRDNTGHVDKIKLRTLFSNQDILCFHDNKL